jgi:hypothetical protein
MIGVATSASFGEQAQRFQPTAVVNSEPYLLSVSDMSGYQLSAQSMQTWRMAPKDGELRAALGVRQVWTSPQGRELQVSYGSFETPEEAAEAVFLFMTASKQPFQEGSFTWQKEDDKSWISLVQSKETIVLVRDKIVFSVVAIVDTEGDRAELEATVLKVLGKIEKSIQK